MCEKGMSAQALHQLRLLSERIFWIPRSDKLQGLIQSGPGFGVTVLQRFIAPLLHYPQDGFRDRLCSITFGGFHLHPEDFRFRLIPCRVSIKSVEIELLVALLVLGMLRNYVSDYVPQTHDWCVY